MAHALDKSLYGSDNRRLVSELNEVTDTKILNLHPATLAQIPTWRITSKNAADFSINTKSLGAGLRLCENEKYLELPVVSSCTAFLVAENLILTAGHCVKDKYECKKNTWVLDFDSELNFKAPNSDITFEYTKSFTCAELISSVTNDKLDFALIRLDRPITDRQPLKIRKTGKVSNKEPLVMIGHPLGMPKIISDQILIRDNSLTFVFKTNADAFSGNSGSPIIGLESGLVEGILIRGEDDFEDPSSQSCQKIKRCSNGDCRGESALRVTEIPLKNIP